MSSNSNASRTLLSLGLSGGLVLGLALVSACGGSGLGSGGDGGNDLSAHADLSSNVDLAVSVVIGPDLAGRDFAGVTCGQQTCGSTEICCSSYDSTSMMVSQACTTDTTCGDGGIAAACDGPEDCSGGTPNCCVDITTTGGVMSLMGQAMCTASCPASAQGGGGNAAMISTKLCHGAADCVNYSGTAPVIGMAAFDSCCGYGGVSFKFCAPSLITALSNQITCNQ